MRLGAGLDDLLADVGALDVDAFGAGSGSGLELTAMGRFWTISYARNPTPTEVDAAGKCLLVVAGFVGALVIST